MNGSLNEICDAMLSGLMHNTVAKQQLRVSEYISEYRTVGAVFPRGTGKTSYIQSLHNPKSSLLFMHCFNINSNTMLDNSVVSFEKIDRLDYRFHEVYSDSVIYSFFLIDEFQYMTSSQKDNLYEIIGILSKQNRLHEDFFVFMIGT